MKLYACYTPSHQRLLDEHFIPSLPDEFRNTLGGDVREMVNRSNVVLKKLKQHSETGDFDSTGFHATCLDKVDFILEAIAAETDPFIFSDVDVRFYGPFAEDALECLGDADIAFQWDGDIGRECSGFMVIRPSNRMAKLWMAVREDMSIGNRLDQDALHVILNVLKPWSPRLAYSSLNTTLLPERYWTFGRNNVHWQPGDAVNPPRDLLMHHANWTVGVENKLALLEAVRHARDLNVYHNQLPEVDVWMGDRGWITGRETSRWQASDSFGTHDMVGALVDGELVRLFVRDEGRTWRRREEATKVEVEPPPQHMCERFPGGPSAALVANLDWQRKQLTSAHHPMPLALVLQFWQRDKHRAMELARLLADMEDYKRDDVGFVFARQRICPMDEEIEETMLYVGKKFPVIHLEAEVDESKSYPGVCFDPWASAARKLAEAYYSGRLIYHSAFFFEADGCPIGLNWIDRLKEAHAETLLAGKYVTGHHMRFGDHDHINGTLIMYLPFFLDHPALHRCSPYVAWDVFFARMLVNHVGCSMIIRNEHGAEGLSESFYHVIGKETAWLTSVKDCTHHHWARQYLFRVRGR